MSLPDEIRAEVSAAVEPVERPSRRRGHLRVLGSQGRPGGLGRDQEVLQAEGEGLMV